VADIGRGASIGGTVVAYRYLVGARIRSDWQYRTSFLLYTLAQAVVTALDLVVILVIFDVVPALGGWSVAEVLVLYGFAMTSFGLADMAISQVETLPRHVVEGSFDRFLLRPLPLVLQLSAAEFALRRVGRIVPGVTALAIGLSTADISWTASHVALVALTLASGVAVFGSVWVLTCSVSFWLVGAREIANAFTYGGSFAHQYPMHILGEWVRAIIGWLLPMAFAGYVGTIHLVGAANPLDLPRWLAFAAPIPVGAFGVVAVLAWARSVRNYQSTGS
jgi:ABC-2 type transport system permease protein